MMQNAFKIALVAGELSGDKLGAAIIKQMKQYYPNAEIIGVGGPSMAQAGQKQQHDYSLLSLIGLFEVLKSLSAILKLRKQLYEYFIAQSIDLFIGIDAPDFNFGLEKRLKEQGIKVIHYVSPSVWAWRKERVYKIANCCNHLLCLFPFEPKYYKDTDLSCTFVTHPMAIQIPINPEEKVLAEQDLELGVGKKRIAVLPGSRLTEVKRNLPVQLATITHLWKQYGSDCKIVIPIARAVLRAPIESIIDSRFKEHKDSICLINGQARTAMQASDVLFLASGTITFEGMLLKKPMLVMYKLHPLSAWLIERRLQTPWVSLPNALAGEFIVPEFLQRYAKPKKMAKCLHQLLENHDMRSAQIKSFAAIHKSLFSNQKAIDVIVDMLSVSK